MSFRDNLNQHLRLRPYIQFDKDDYMMKLFHFNGTTFIYSNGYVYKHRYMYVYDVESKSFIWIDDLRGYVIQKFGDLIYKPLYVRHMTFDEVVFKIIIVDVYAENYMVVNSHAVSCIYYKCESKFTFSSCMVRFAMTTTFSFIINFIINAVVTRFNTS